ncbi:MAG: phosphate-starvation-inducible PsiE family protein [Acidimicrobiia bacterium]|nr:phosphate-starvation-inducible PsiE family protein [Acidimicrobiia bacterium]
MNDKNEKDQKDAEDERAENERSRPSREQRAGDRQNVVATSTTRALHIAEDAIYAVTAVLLVTGALVVLVQAIWRFANEVDDGVIHAVEGTLDSLLIVFILVELLSAVRSAIAQHELVAEPFLLVGMLAVIKEIVVEATFSLNNQKATDIALKMGVLGGVVLAFAVSTLLMRKREREPEED